MSKHDEFIDEELVGIGVKFTDETVPKEMPTMEYRDGSGSQKKPEQKRCEAVDAKYVPVPKGNHILFRIRFRFPAEHIRIKSGLPNNQSTSYPNSILP